MTTPSKASQRMVPVDAQTPPQDRSGDALGTPGGVTGSQAVSKRFPRSDLGDALRAAANYQDRPGAYDDLRTLADRADALEAESADGWARYHEADRRADALEREAARLGDLVDETKTIARGYRADAGRLAGEVLRLNSQVERVRALAMHGDIPLHDSKRVSVEDIRAALDGTQ